MIGFGGCRFAFALALATFALGTPARAGGFYKTFCAGSGADGSIGVDCPCNNTVPAGTVSGCKNRTGNGASLVPSGNASISGDTLVLTVSGTPLGVHGFFFAGTAARSSTPLGDGTLCIRGPFTRLSKVAHSSGSDSIPLPSGPSISQLMNATVGDVDFFQFVYRDASGPCGNGANTTNAVLVIWGT
jgi:hypothetical protein